LLFGTSRYVLEVSIVGWVVPERALVNASARGTASNYSKGIAGRLRDSAAPRGLLVAVAVVAAVLLVAAELSPLYTVVVGALETPRRSVSAGSHHGYALVLLALAAVAMALGALRGARAAAAALVAFGAAALIVALAIDLPATRDSATLPEAVAYADARARAGCGLTLEIAGGAALLVAGGLLLVLGRGRPGREPVPGRR
jgi:hypothetical protein